MSILTVTLNPAIDLTTDVDKVESGYKLRCGPARLDPGGGGVNVSRAIAKLGGASTPFVAIGGATGEMLKSLLDAEGVAAEWFAVGGLTRQSVVVNERSTRKQFRFALPGPQWSPAEAARVLTALEATFANGRERIAYVVASGSLPPGLPDDFYHGVGDLATRAGARFLLDTSGRELDLVARGSEHPPYVWIMDQREAESVAGRPLPGLDALERFGRELKAHKAAEIVILTFAEGGAVALSNAESLRIVPPKIEVVSKVGAGDSFVGGLVLKLSAGAPLNEACAYAVAAAASAVTSPATALCNREDTERYFAMILDRRT
ncbi:MAG: 1-phosphofructokinase family hexose kinase [Rhodomicrobiaceae bacterium]